MPLANQPVYSPASGAPIESTWGQGVAEAVVQRFASVAERDSEWTSPPTGARCWIGPATGTDGDRGMEFRRWNNAWQPIGSVVQAINSSRASIGADDSWVNVPFDNTLTAIGGSFDGWGFYPPYTGRCKIEISAFIACGTSLGASDHNAWHQVACGMYTPAGPYRGTLSSQAFTGGQYNVGGFVLMNVAPSSGPMQVQMYVSGATSMYKTWFEGANLTIDYI